MLTMRLTDTWYMVRYKRLVWFGTKRALVEERCNAHLRANPHLTQPTVQAA